MKISNKLKTMVASFAVAVMGVAFVAAPTFAAGGTCPAGSLRAGDSYETNISECNISDEKKNDNLMATLTTIINVIVAAVGFVAVVMIIVGGIMYTTSSGDTAKVKKAKDTIMYGVIGLVIALLAFAIVNFVLSSVVISTDK